MLLIALWYPARSAGQPTSYPLPGGTMHAGATRDAAPAEGPFPLVIFSHGGGACATSGAVFAEELAADGFVVAAPDHDDEFIACRSDGSLPPDSRRTVEWFRWAASVSAGRCKTKFEHRPRDVAATIDAVLAAGRAAEGDLRGLVDPNRIGATGVSFGAWTTLVVGGAIPAYRDERLRAVAPIAGPAREPA